MYFYIAVLRTPSDICCTTQHSPVFLRAPPPPSPPSLASVGKHSLYILPPTPSPSPPLLHPFSPSSLLPLLPPPLLHSFFSSFPIQPHHPVLLLTSPPPPHSPPCLSLPSCFFSTHLTLSNHHPSALTLLPNNLYKSPQQPLYTFTTVLTHPHNSPCLTPQYPLPTPTSTLTYPQKPLS